MKKEKSKFEKPEPNVGDRVHTTVKALISAVPGIGGPAAELFAAVIIPPLERRREEWMETIALGLEELEETVEGFKIKNLSQNQTFITTVMHATQVAIRTHQKEKLEALRNAVLNSALPNAPEDDLQLIFLTYIDDLTPYHLIILNFLNESNDWELNTNWKPVQHTLNIKTGKGLMKTIDLSKSLECKFRQFKGKNEFYKQFVRDLNTRGLINIESLNLTTPQRTI